MNLSEQLDNYINGLLPTSLAELKQSSQQLDKIAQISIGEYKTNPDETKMKTQNAVNEGLQTVAQHIFAVSTHLNNLLTLQDKQVEKLDLEIRSALARIKGAHIRVGQAGLQKLYKERIPIEGEKTHKLKEEQIQAEYKQKTLINIKGYNINFEALDNIGISLSNPNQESNTIKMKNKSENPIQEAIIKSSERKEEEKTETETETETDESISKPKSTENTSKTSLAIENKSPPILPQRTSSLPQPPIQNTQNPSFDNIPPPIGDDFPPPIDDLPPPIDNIPLPIGDDFGLMPPPINDDFPPPIDDIPPPFDDNN
ncbi:abelson interacting protein isoform d [Anaeramoeba ignava]|uniref:Abelson interacting protein isoform d n=1 Tax=Anaeramoeba ignava TaxID=1746090 RepID=A0A9Q0LYT3_ANAIG|nr:abelson interacting protein isoform d [Anaeramoeba ignava]